VNLKSYFFLLIFITLCSCETDFDITASYKDTMVVYGLLDPTQDIQSIRINKSYLGREDAETMGENYDSIQYPDSVLEVSIYIDEDTSNRFYFIADTIEKNDDGSFATDNNVVYMLTDSEDLFDDSSAVYNLVILNKENNEITTSSTNLITDFELIKSDISGPFRFYDPTPAPGNTNFPFKKIRWSSAIYNGSYSDLTYQIDLQINYLEDNKDTLSILWKQAPIISQQVKDGEIILEGQQFFNFLSNNISQDPNKIRNFLSLDLIISIGSPELTKYININQPSSGISQERLEYTNINNGIGIFSSRSTRILSFFNLDRCSLDHLLTLDRNFVLTNLQNQLQCQ